MGGIFATYCNALVKVFISLGLNFISKVRITQKVFVEPQ